MPIDEAGRVRLFNRLEEVLGREEAFALMSSLPSFPIDDLATKADLRHEIDKLRYELTALIHREITNQTRTLIFALVATVVSISSVARFQ